MSETPPAASSAASAASPAWLPVLLSSCLPGLGQVRQGRFRQGLLILAVTLLLLLIGHGLGRVADLSAEIFYLMLIVLPWWALQAYDASFSDDGRPTGRRTLIHSLKQAWSEGHDLRYLGALFFLSAFMDLYIIAANPDYALPVFCSKPTGWLGLAAKAQSPPSHLLIGYGFVRLRRWALVFYLVYAAYQLISAMVNYVCFGYGRIRTVMFVTLLLFTGYIVWRRDRFA
ncbi:MAG TPA: hypothetical protein VLA99_02505 [Nitrospiraceae bacterium]|nr:hypothetical protein [Nitrospiraceae bacterium]